MHIAVSHRVCYGKFDVSMTSSCMWNVCFITFLFEFPGFGCDTAAVVNILAHRDATQRALIQQEYRAMYSEDLFKRLSKELTGKLEVLILIYKSIYLNTI